MVTLHFFFWFFKSILGLFWHSRWWFWHSRWWTLWIVWRHFGVMWHDDWNAIIINVNKFGCFAHHIKLINIEWTLLKIMGGEPPKKSPGLNMVNRHPLYNSTPNMQVPLLQKVFLFSGTSTNRHVPDVDTCHKGTLCYDPGYIQTLHLGGHFFWSQGYLLTGGCTVHFDQLWFILLWKTVTFEEQEWRERFRSTINHHSRKRCSLFPSLTVIFK